MFSKIKNNLFRQTWLTKVKVAIALAVACSAGLPSAAYAEKVVVQKTGPATANVGGNISYVLTAVNNPLLDDTFELEGDVFLYDPGPVGLTFVSATAPCTGGFPCNLGKIAAGNSVGPITVTFSIPTGQIAAHGNTLTNEATVTSSYWSPADELLETHSATSTVITSLVQPQPPALTFTKAFSASNIALNGSTALTFTLSATGGDGTTPISGLAFSDALPAGLIVATPNGLSATTCPGGGAITAVAGAAAVSLSGGIIPAAGTCTFSVNVQGTTAGVKDNSVTTTAGDMTNGNQTATASVTVDAPAPATVIANVPTLNEWGVALLMALMALVGMRHAKRRDAAAD